MTCLTSSPPPLPKLPPLAMHKKKTAQKKKRKTLKELVEDLQDRLKKEQAMRKKAEAGITGLMQTTRQAREEAEAYQSALKKHGIPLPPMPREEVEIE